MFVGFLARGTNGWARQVKMGVSLMNGLLFGDCEGQTGQTWDFFDEVFAAQ